MPVTYTLVCSVHSMSRVHLHVEPYFSGSTQLISVTPKSLFTQFYNIDVARIGETKILHWPLCCCVSLDYQNILYFYLPRPLLLYPVHVSLTCPRLCRSQTSSWFVKDSRLCRFSNDHFQLLVCICFPRSRQT